MKAKQVNDGLAPGLYQHFKGGRYEVIGVATHSESREQMVVYRCLYGNFDLWVRPMSMFCASVDVNGEKLPRFSYCGPMADDIEV